MTDSYSIYEAKTNLSMIVRDSAEKGKVFTISNAQRKRAPRAVVLGEEILRLLLEGYVCTPEWEEDSRNGMWTVYIPEIDDWGQGSTKEEAVLDLLEGVKELADTYLSELPFYLRGGRTRELPYLLKIALAEDLSGVRRVLGL